MSESANLPMNFGGIEDEALSSFERARVVVWPVSYEGTVSYGTGTGAGAKAIIDASRNMELYDEETDAEVYRLGIHTTVVTPPAEPPEAMMKGLLARARELVATGKFVCMIGGEHSVSAPVIQAHAEKFENLSVLQIDAHADLRDTYDGTPHSHASIMARVVKDLKLPAVQVGIRSLSRERRVVGMDLTEYSYVEGFSASAFLCAKLIYKSLAYIFEAETERVRSSRSQFTGARA